MVLITISLATLLGKWIMGGSAAGYGTYKATQTILNTPEISLKPAVHAAAEYFEQPVVQSNENALAAEDGLPPHLDHMASMAMEGNIGDQANRKGAEEAASGKRYGRGGAFVRHWVAELRLEFPQRQNRASDRAVMSKWLVGKLRNHGVRIAHMADMVPRCVALALNQSRAEVEASLEAEAAKIRTLGQRLVYRAKRWLGATPSQALLEGC